MSVSRQSDQAVYTWVVKPAKGFIRLRRFGAVFAFLWACIMIIGGIYLMPRGVTSAALGFVLVIFHIAVVVLAIDFWIMLGIEQIVLSRKGIEYQTRAHHIWAAWEDVRDVAMLPQGRSLAPFIRLQKWEITNVSSAPRIADTRPEKGIPLGSFENWRKGEIGQALHRYAPHVVTDIES